MARYPDNGSRSCVQWTRIPSPQLQPDIDMHLLRHGHVTTHRQSGNAHPLATTGRMARPRGRIRVPSRCTGQEDEGRPGSKDTIASLDALLGMPDSSTESEQPPAAGDLSPAPHLKHRPKFACMAGAGTLPHGSCSLWATVWLPCLTLLRPWAPACSIPLARCNSQHARAPDTEPEGGRAAQPRGQGGGMVVGPAQPDERTTQVRRPASPDAPLLYQPCCARPAIDF